MPPLPWTPGAAFDLADTESTFTSLASRCRASQYRAGVTVRSAFPMTNGLAKST